ncbi:D-2-hydroxyacid dehydrogenase [Puia sp.]|jgi:glycerate dehydrogenase|uniref:D-2-hydroxyacid dehydrogenase n=1 Tax=Puia sp. TaxID=2045100 RepID=UPI002F41B921
MSQKIIAIDGYTLNPGDLSWDPWREYGELTVYERTPYETDAIVGRCAGAAAVLTNKTPFTRETLARLPGLKYIGVTATGYNMIDIAAAKQQGIVVSNVPGYGTASVVQMTFALLLELTHRVQRHSDAVMDGKWSRSPDFSFWDYPLVELSGKTIGIIGMGHIGSKVADIATAFGMKVIGNSRTQTDQSHRPGFRWAAVDQLLAQSDVVSIHCPLFPETLGLINKKTLAGMKPTAFLLNTSRGPIIVEQDLVEALDAGRLAGAGLDVLSTEPPPAGNPLFKAKNCIITPHISWATKEARTRLMTATLANFAAWHSGHPTNVL